MRGVATAAAKAVAATEGEGMEEGKAVGTVEETVEARVAVVTVEERVEAKVAAQYHGRQGT